HAALRVLGVGIAVVLLGDDHDVRVAGGLEREHQARDAAADHQDVRRFAHAGGPSRTARSAASPLSTHSHPTWSTRTSALGSGHLTASLAVSNTADRSAAARSISARASSARNQW